MAASFVKRFRRVRTGNPEVQALQAALAPLLDGLAAIPVLDGRLVKAQMLTPGQDNPVNHGLGRTPAGWILAGQNAQAGVWEVAGTTPGKTLILRASALVTVNLWIF